MPEPREHLRHCLGLAVDRAVAEGRLKMGRQDCGRATHQRFRDLDPHRLHRASCGEADVGVELGEEISRCERLRVDDRPGRDGVTEPPLQVARGAHDPDRDPRAVGIGRQKVRPILRPCEGVIRPVAADRDRVVPPTLRALGKLVRLQHRGPVALMQLQLPGRALELRPDLRTARGRPHVLPQHLLYAPGNSLGREIAPSLGVEQRMIDDQELAVSLDLGDARGQMKKDARMMSQRKARRDRHLRVDQVGKAALDCCADQRVDQLRPLQKGALHLQQCSAIAASGLRPNFLCDRAPGGAWQTQIADDHDIIDRSRHRSPTPAASAQAGGAADQGAIWGSGRDCRGLRLRRHKPGHSNAIAASNRQYMSTPGTAASGGAGPSIDSVSSTMAWNASVE
jgi:hypothetical protein